MVAQALRGYSSACAAVLPVTTYDACMFGQTGRDDRWGWVLAFVFRRRRRNKIRWIPIELSKSSSQKGQENLSTFYDLTSLSLVEPHAKMFSIPASGESRNS